MGQQGDYGQYGQGQPRRPQQQGPRLRPAATPPQWGQQAPPRQDGTRGQRYPQEPQAQPAFQPAYPSRPQPPRGQYPPPQPPRQPQYQPQPQYAPGAPPQPPQRHRKSRKGLAFLGCGGLGALVVLIAVLASSSSQSPSAPAAGTQQTQAAAPPAQSAAPAKAAAQTVTYVVTGSDAQVTYGPAGSSLSGSVPMRVTKDIPSSAPLYYDIQAQLQGGGSVSCEIEVNGAVISSSTATGGYNIASCEIGQDPFSGQWQDDNG
jgi:hypothetical protein